LNRDLKEKQNLEREIGEARTLQEKEIASDVAETVTHVVYLTWSSEIHLISPEIILENGLFRILFLTMALVEMQTHLG
jgi:hypothetical protein